MLQDEFKSVLQIKTGDELLNELLGHARGLGFDKVGATVVVDRTADGGSEFLCVNNVPAECRDWFENVDYGRRDPVMQHCKRSHVPIVWDQEVYTSVGMGAMWEEQARHGYSTGICFAMHLPNGFHFVLGVERDRALPANRAEVGRLAAELQLLAVHAQEPAFRVLLPESLSLPADVPDLTMRELESLRWTMEGKTAWELSRILGISEQTVVRHLNNATHKLNCVNKHHAVVKALRLGLIR